MAMKSPGRIPAMKRSLGETWKSAFDTMIAKMIMGTEGGMMMPREPAEVSTSASRLRPVMNFP